MNLLTYSLLKIASLATYDEGLFFVLRWKIFRLFENRSYRYNKL